MRRENSVFASSIASCGTKFEKFTPEQIELALALLAQGKTYSQITTMTGISKSTLIRAKRSA